MGKSASAAEATKPKTATGRERRKQERFACSGFAEVVLNDAAFLFRGTILDLSRTGCYIQSRARLMLERGTTVELRFSVQNEELLLPAKIMIIRPGAGAGFEFFEIQPRMLDRLSSLINKLADPTSKGRTAQNQGLGASAGESSTSTTRDLWHQD